MAIETPNSNLPIEAGSLSTQDVFEQLGGEDTAESIEVIGRDDKEVETKEEDVIKLVEDEPEIETEINLVAPFRKAEIEKDFPGIFKKYGYLERAYYTERAYRDIFASPEDAKEAQEQVETLKNIEQSLLNGSTSEILSELKGHDERAFARVVDNYLPSLYKVDPAAHNHLVTGVTKNLILLLAKEANATNNDELRKVALAINRFVFQSDKFEPHTLLSGQNAQTEAVDAERQKFFEERFQVAQEEIATKVNEVLTATIKANLDPKNVLSDYIKKVAIRDAVDELRNTLDSDRSYRKQLDKFWERAFENNFSRDSVTAIRKAVLSKAQTVLPQVIKKARNEALRGVGKVVKDDGDSDTQKTEREYVTRPRGSASSSQSRQEDKKPFKGSTLDYLNSD